MDLKKYPSLNGLRAISIFLVLNLHLGLKNNIFQSFYGIKWAEPFVFFIQDGALGVNIFFVISGFLITSLLLKEESNSGTISLSKFYIRRVLRIFPAYYFLLLVYFILQLFNIIYISNSSWLTSLTYTKYLNGRLDWYTAHFWSLSLEELFYFFWPFIFLSGIKTRKTVAFAVVLLIPFLRIFIHKYTVAIEDQLNIFTKIDSIALGCLFALYKDTIINRLSKYWSLAFYSSALVLLFLRYLPDSADKINLGFIFVPLGLSDGSLANLAVAIIMMYSVFGPRGIWFKFLNLKFINYIGILSYSIYLWQQLFISSLGYWVNNFPQNILCILAMSIFSYNVIEKPFLRLKTKFSK
jgi:peptidoglycan/LPS O-acetylase OafA/YrhL